jgi:riboflavin-specific deaminase-like protein
VQALARAADELAATRRRTVFAQNLNGELRPVGDSEVGAIAAWRPGTGWELLVPDEDPRRAFLELYLPICSASAARPMTIGHLGESLDGFIATQSGESQWVTGEQNLLHMHRLRALSDAVLVGAGTIAADDPQLTTRLVSGASPLRVVLDPGRRLGADYRVFTDNAAETLYVCARSLTDKSEHAVGRATIVGVDERPDGVNGIDAAAVIQLLRARGCSRVFVEGGGVTVSMFLEARLLDRLHIAIAPVFIGDGRPAIRISPSVALGECPRPAYRVFRMGGDILFDCDFTSPQHDDSSSSSNPPTDMTRVI